MIALFRPSYNRLVLAVKCTFSAAFEPPAFAGLQVNDVSPCAPIARTISTWHGMSFVNRFGGEYVSKTALRRRR